MYTDFYIGGKKSNFYVKNKPTEIQATEFCEMNNKRNLLQYEKWRWSQKKQKEAL